MNVETAMDHGEVFIVGVDPGPESSALATIRISGLHFDLIKAWYVKNDAIKSMKSADPFLALADEAPCYLAYESCGAQGKFVGSGTFETAAMGGEIRHLFRQRVDGIYSFSPADWRYLLCGRGNADTRAIYASSCARFGVGTGNGADPYKGTKAHPGQLAALHAAGAGGNMEHVKDALGVALALTQSRFRTGESPERFRIV